MKNDIDQTILVLLNRFNHQRLPRVISLKQKVEKGECLNDLDIAFLERIVLDFASTQNILSEHAQYKQFIVRVVGLYHSITTKALENERAA